MEGLSDLDFDRVLCDSCGESSVSAVKAAKVRWPALFDSVDTNREDWIVDQMYTVRPVVETGYENVLLVSLLPEMRVPSIQKSSVELLKRLQRKPEHRGCLLIELFNR